MSIIPKNLNSVLIKPSGPDCNLECDYCFYLDKAHLFENKIHRMTEDVLEELTKQVMHHCGGEVSFVWQGGEPTLMGIPFFEKAVSLQCLYGFGKNMANSLQTNGLLIDENWSDFLHDNRFLVGLSLDGPKHIHDHYRKHATGKGSYEKVAEAGIIMLERGVEVNALSVINDYSVKFPEELYNYFKEFGHTFMRFIPCVEPDPSTENGIAQFSVSAEAYGEFLCRMFDLWHGDIKDGVAMTSVRYFDSIFYSYVDMRPPDCTLQFSCGEYVVVEHNGDIFSCDFYVEPGWKLGNVLSDDMNELLNSSKQARFRKMKAVFTKPCASCEWLQKCWGGCTKERYGNSQDRGLSYFCESYKMFFSHANESLTTLAKKWKEDAIKAGIQD